MSRTTVTNSKNDMEFGADIIQQDKMRMKIVIDGTDQSITMEKRAPEKKYYIGNIKGVEFYSTGE